VKVKFGKDLSSSRKETIIELLRAKWQAFQRDDRDVGLTDLIEHEIDTGNHKPIRQRQFRLPQATSVEVDKQLEELLRNNQVEPSQSPWCHQC
jgi:hypothetical protein